ncbi:transketolase, partial [Pediococcus acidilactici]
GMAMAERHLAALVNRPGYPVFNHFTYALVGDGDLMEGVSQEAINIAGQKQLNKLIVLYDSNDVSLDGPLSLSANENVAQRFKAANWNYQKVTDGNDLAGLQQALQQAQTSDRPTLIEVKTIIGYGTPESGTNKVHGNALGKANLAAMRQFYHWQAAPFEIAPEIYQHYQEQVAKKQTAYQAWQTMFQEYQTEFPEVYRQFQDARLDTTKLNLDDPAWQ